MMEVVALAISVGSVYCTFEYCSICSTQPSSLYSTGGGHIMHGDPGRGPGVNMVHNNNNLYPPQNLAGLRNNMHHPPPRVMYARNHGPPVGTVFIRREDDNMSQLSLIRNLQHHTRHNQNSYFGEGNPHNEEDPYPAGLSESIMNDMYGDDHTLSESTRPDGGYGGDEYLYLTGN
jgi:hypothetical protein